MSITPKVKVIGSVTAYPSIEGETVSSYGGLKIREYIATQALAGLLAKHGSTTPYDTRQVAHSAVQYADALLEELASNE